MALRLAIIEDNADLLDELLAWLGYRGFEVWGTRSAEAFWRQLHSHPVDIVLVDIGLPGEDGFSVLNYLHELGHYGLVVVSARGQQQDKLQALSLGADAYLIKPVNFAHLAETLTALGARLRQDRPAAPPAEAIGTPPAVSPGSWRLQEDKLISPDARTLELTQQEYRLVELLMRNRNEVCSKLDLHACLFSHESEPDLHRIDVVVSRLRHKARQQGIHLPVRAIFGSLIILHSYDQLPEDEFMINCLKGVIFVSLKTASIPQLLTIIKSELQHCMTPTATDAAGRELSCASCPHRVLSRSQTAVAHGILEGLDMSKIAALQRVSPRTAAYHKNKIMEKYSLNNNHEFFQFMNLLRERW